MKNSACLAKYLRGWQGYYRRAGDRASVLRLEGWIKNCSSIRIAPEDDSLVDQSHGLLSTNPNLEWVAPDLPIADKAAQLRAQHRPRTPNALQIATAIRADATAIVTNDEELMRVPGVEVFVLARSD